MRDHRFEEELLEREALLKAEKDNELISLKLTGFEGNSYFYNDPDAEVGGKHKVKADVLIGAIYSAQINSDNYLLSVKV